MVRSTSKAHQNLRYFVTHTIVTDDLENLPWKGKDSIWTEKNNSEPVLNRSVRNGGVSNFAIQKGYGAVILHTECSCKINISYLLRKSTIVHSFRFGALPLKKGRFWECLDVYITPGGHLAPRICNTHLSACSLYTLTKPTMGYILIYFRCMLSVSRSPRRRKTFLGAKRKNPQTAPPGECLRQTGQIAPQTVANSRAQPCNAVICRWSMTWTQCASFCDGEKSRPDRSFAIQRPILELRAPNLHHRWLVIC